MPRLRNTGSTISGPSRSAGVSPIKIGVIALAPTSSGPTRATKLSERSARRRLAQAIGGAGETAGAEHALVEAQDRFAVGGRLRFEHERQIGHEGF